MKNGNPARYRTETIPPLRTMEAALRAAFSLDSGASTVSLAVFNNALVTPRLPGLDVESVHDDVEQVVGPGSPILVGLDAPEKAEKEK